MVTITSFHRYTLEVCDNHSCRLYRQSGIGIQPKTSEFALFRPEEGESAKPHKTAQKPHKKAKKGKQKRKNG